MFVYLLKSPFFIILPYVLVLRSLTRDSDWLIVNTPKLVLAFSILTMFMSLCVLMAEPSSTCINNPLSTVTVKAGGMRIVQKHPPTPAPEPPQKDEDEEEYVASR